MNQIQGADNVTLTANSQKKLIPLVTTYMPVLQEPLSSYC